MSDLIRERTSKVPNITGASPQLRPFLEACLKPQPEDRPASAEEATSYLPDLLPEPWWRIELGDDINKNRTPTSDWFFDDYGEKAGPNEDFEERRSERPSSRSADELLSSPAPKARPYSSGRLALSVAVAVNLFLLAAIAFVAFFSSPQTTTSPGARPFSSVDLATFRSVGLIAGGFAICASGLALVRLFHARSDDARTQLRYAATEAINDPGGADWLSRTIFVQIEEYQKIARSTGDRILTLTLVKLARDMVGADSLADQHRAMSMFIDLHDKLSARLAPQWLNYEKLVGRTISALSLVTGALTVFQGLRELF